MWTSFSRRILAALAGLVLATAASAHFAYVVPAADGSKVQVIFSDSLEADLKVPIDKIAATTLFQIDSSGKATAIKLTKGKHALSGALPGKEVRLIGGVSDYGFHQSKHTQFKAVRLKYYPKAIVGQLAGADKILLGDKALVEIVPVAGNGKVRFKVLLKGKPLPRAEIGVLIPGETPYKGLTDAKGLTEASFDKTGKYGVRARYIEPVAGEINGQKYEEVRHYGTLVLDFSPSVPADR